MPPAGKLRWRCPIIKIEEQRDNAIRAELKQARLWRGEAEMVDLMGEHEKILVLIDGNGGEFNREWSVRSARLARIVLAARNAAAFEAAKPVSDGPSKASEAERIARAKGLM